MKSTINFLEKEEFLKLKNIIHDDYFPWYKNDGVVHSNDLYLQFTHTFFRDGKVNSPYFDILNPLLKKINPFCLLRIKLNLLPKTDNTIEHGMHVDLDDNKYRKDITTGIYYINSNNGYTKFINNDIVKSEENKLITFDSDLKHTGSTCTDKNYRIVLNMNYFQNKK